MPEWTPVIVTVLPNVTVENRILAEARRGSRQAMIQIYDNYFPPIYGFILMRVEDAQMAEDIASEVFVEFATALQLNKGPTDSLRGWLFRVAGNLIHDHYRSSSTTTVLEDWMPAFAGDEPETQALRSMDAAIVRQAIQALSEDQQQVLFLRFWQGMNLCETAAIMGRREGAIKSLQFRAVNTLRQLLTQV